MNENSGISENCKLFGIIESELLFLRFAYNSKSSKEELVNMLFKAIELDIDDEIISYYLRAYRKRAMAWAENTLSWKI